VARVRVRVIRVRVRVRVTIRVKVRITIRVRVRVRVRVRSRVRVRIRGELLHARAVARLHGREEAAAPLLVDLGPRRRAVDRDEAQLGGLDELQDGVCVLEDRLEHLFA